MHRQRPGRARGQLRARRGGHPLALRTRKDYFGLEVGIDASQIVAASRLVSQTTGFVVQPNKAVVGANAFAHASGIHQDGVLKARDTYEIMRAEDVGWATNKIVLGKLSGRNAFKQRLGELGIEMQSEAEVNAAFVKFKELADRKSDIFDEDIIALAMDEAVTAEHEHYRLISLAQHSEMGARPQASVSFAAGELEHSASSDGNGPVDASLKAIESKVASGAEMLLYSVNAITSGSTESARRGDGAAAARRPDRQRVGRRPGHRRRVGQSVSVGVEQASQPERSGRSAGVTGSEGVTKRPAPAFRAGFPRIDPTLETTRKFLILRAF